MLEIFIKPHCKGGSQSILAGYSALLLSGVIDFILAGNSFIVRCHVSSK